MNLNVMLIIVLAVFVLKVANGYKKGMVKEIVSVVSLIILSAMLALVAYGVHSYLDGMFMGVAAAVVLLVILILVHHLINIVVAPVKLLVKLPIVHFADKLLGVIFGAVEVLFILWTVYILIMMFDLGTIGDIIAAYTRDSAFLTWMYQHNYPAQWVEGLVGEFAENVPF